MRKLITALNMTLDGICDHTVGIPDKETHQLYTEILGRRTPFYMVKNLSTDGILAKDNRKTFP
ncbi:MAG: hypothetical protein WAT79_10085 [Saprospiraceae bacterium]